MIRGVNKALPETHGSYHVHHHPSEAMLMGYALGNLSAGFALAVETHLAYCSQCRRDVALMAELGGTLIEEVAPAPMGDNALDAALAAIEGNDDDTAITVKKAFGPSYHGADPLPGPLGAFGDGPMEQLLFKKRAPGIANLPLMKERDGTYTRLLRIEGGKSVPQHTHTGIELTVLLSGSYHDEVGVYGPGDFVEHDDTVRHQPIAGMGEDCICLGVTEGPLRFSKPLYEVLKPFFPV